MEGGPTALTRALLASLAIAGAAGAETDSGTTAAQPSVGLERLLRLPRGYQVEEPRRAGASPSEWRSRFAAARAELAQAEAALEQSRRELEEIAAETSNWQVAAPGGATAASENATLSYKLVQEIRRRREEVERAEQRLTELSVEANLAGVPEDWRQ